MRKANSLFAGAMIVLTMLGASQAQVGPGMRVISLADGLTVSGPASGQFFRMRIVGENVQRMRTTKKYWFLADGVRFEFFSEDNSHFLITDIPYRLDDRVVLRLYRSAFVHRNGDLKVNSDWVKLPSGEAAVFWSYDKSVATPEAAKSTEREMFLVVAGPAHVFGLFARVPADGSEKKVRRLLTRTLGTLTFGDEFDPKE